jgi:hypothetical protein
MNSQVLKMLVKHTRSSLGACLNSELKPRTLGYFQSNEYAGNTGTAGFIDTIFSQHLNATQNSFVRSPDLLK